MPRRQIWSPTPRLGRFSNPALPITALPRGTAKIKQWCIAAAFCSVWIDFLVGSPLLEWIGIPYGEPGGDPFAKFLPGTYLSLLALVLYLCRAGLPLQQLVQAARSQPRIFWFLGMMLFCCADSLAINGFGSASLFIENYLPAGIVCFIMVELCTVRQVRNFAFAVIGLMALNNALGLWEFATNSHFVPIIIQGTAISSVGEDFRGYALYGHPLIVAEATMIGVFLILGCPLRPLWKYGLIAFFVVALLNFGGRTALVFTIGTLIIWGAIKMVRSLANGELKLRTLALGLVFICGAAGLMAALADLGFGERIISHLYWDDSAETRAVQWALPFLLTPRELLLGVTPDALSLAIQQLGMSVPFVGVENFWLATFLWLGLFGFPFFLVGFWSFLIDLWVRVAIPGRIILVTGILVASSSASLGAKDPLITFLAPCCLATAAFGTPGLEDDDALLGSRAR